MTPSYGLAVTGKTQCQSDYVQKLLTKADRLDAVFVTWWCIVDLDTLWLESLGQDPLAQIWRDTGLCDEALQSRLALTHWDDGLARPMR